MDGNEQQNRLQERWVQLAMSELMFELEGTHPHTGKFVPGHDPVMHHYAAVFSHGYEQVTGEAEAMLRWAAQAPRPLWMAVLQGLDARGRGHMGQNWGK